jgi:3-hydroxy acid dehydrogenase / malonic semialdehyde reductase
MQPLKDKTIFITGATSGFGHAFATRFAKAGARIVATGRRMDRLKTLQKAIGKGHAHIIEFDVREKEAVEESVASLPKAFKNIDVLINNAGLALGFDRVPNTRLDDWEQMVDTNIKGVLYCTNALLPGMVKRECGHIVNIGSVAGNYPYPGGNVYGATKAFLRQFSLNLRAELLGTPLRVTNIEPGMAETEFSIVRLRQDKKKAAAVYEGMQPLTADDIAEAVLFCLSQPPHVNINALELMPTQQAFSPFAVHREVQS